MSKGTDINERCSWPANTIFSIGIPNVRDLCVEQKMIATVSAGVKPELFLVEKMKVKSMKLSWIETIMNRMRTRLNLSRSMCGFENVSQNVV